MHVVIISEFNKNITIIKKLTKIIKYKINKTVLLLFILTIINKI